VEGGPQQEKYADARSFLILTLPFTDAS